VPPNKVGPIAPNYTVTFGPNTRVVFERVGDEWIYFDDAQGSSAQRHKVNDLCETTSSGERLSDQGIFVSVMVHDPNTQATSRPVSAPITVEATYDDTGHHATHEGTITLNEQGSLVCQHADN